MWKLTLVDKTGDISKLYMLTLDRSIEKDLEKEGKKILKIERGCKFEVEL